MGIGIQIMSHPPMGRSPSTSKEIQSQHATIVAPLKLGKQTKIGTNWQVECPCGSSYVMPQFVVLVEKLLKSKILMIWEQQDRQSINQLKKTILPILRKLLEVCTELGSIFIFLFWDMYFGKYSFRFFETKKTFFCSEDFCLAKPPILMILATKDALDQRQLMLRLLMTIMMQGRGLGINTFASSRRVPVPRSREFINIPADPPAGPPDWANPHGSAKNVQRRLRKERRRNWKGEGRSGHPGTTQAQWDVPDPLSR